MLIKQINVLTNTIIIINSISGIVKKAMGIFLMAENISSHCTNII